MTVGAVILAGGKSSRMKVSNKALLLWNGRSFLERLLLEMQGFKELLISADRSDRYPEYANRVVPDKFPGIGPIGALYSVLSICQSDAMIVTACDTPFFSKGLAEYLLSHLSYEWDAVVVEDCSGRIHPLCGIYQKAALPFFLEQIQSGDYKMSHLLNRLRVKRVNLCGSCFSDECLRNINRPQDYLNLLNKQIPPAIIAISGVKNSGKTTALEKLIPRLKDFGYRIAVIKHDGHDFTTDVPGTDSYRFQQAGADGVAVFSSARYMVVQATPDISVEALIQMMGDVDLVLLEGFKNTPYPKIEIIRGTVSINSVCQSKTLLAILTDTDIQVEHVPSIPLDDIDTVASIIDCYAKSHIPKY